MPHPNAPPLKRKRVKPPPRPTIERLARVRKKPVKRLSAAAVYAISLEHDRLRSQEQERKRKLARPRQIKRKYGLEKGALAAMLERQSYACVTCNRGQFALGKPLCVDHCHRTGKVRGLLCSDCNFALGFAKDNPQTLRLLALYVEFHATRE